MDLILWRHAEAEDGSPDLARRLTRKGEHQAQRMAGWLAQRIGHDYRLVASPATRAQQTANALRRDFETVARIAPDTGAVPDVLTAAGWPDAGGCVVVVGHQPTLGCAAALLLTGREATWSVKKGAVWWFQSRVRHDDGQVILRAVISPDMV